MFWGCFSGTIKGPEIVIKKAWGLITSAMYCKRILPLIDRHLKSYSGLVLMQNNCYGFAPSRCTCTCEHGHMTPLYLSQHSLARVI